MSETRDSKHGSTEVITFGCRLNAYESEVMRTHAARAGLGDAVIVNTCAVTAEAARQARQTIRRIARERPDARLVVTGCAAQVDPDSFARLDGVNAVIGNGEKLDGAMWGTLAKDARIKNTGAKESPTTGVAEKDADPRAGMAAPDGFLDAGTPRVAVNDIFAVTETAGHLIDGFGDRARAFVQIQNGCNHRCTFCIIPYGRGNSRSVPMGGVVDQIKRLVDTGYGEVVLTGVDITSFGEDLPGTPSLGVLVQKILTHVPDLPRLRISSIDSIEVDGPLMDAITGETRVMPHLHLSLQAGDNMILKRMKRRHLREDAIHFCTAVRARRPEVVFGADIIAGFPTETDEMFANSLRLVEECDLTWLHVFPYSEREGTPAARIPNKVAKAVRKERAARLRAHGEARVKALFARRAGTRAEVLVERGGGGMATGHTEDFIPVTLTGDHRPGARVLVTLVHHDGRTMRGLEDGPDRAQGTGYTDGHTHGYGHGYAHGHGCEPGAKDGTA